MNIISESVKRLASRKKPFNTREWYIDFSLDPNHLLNEDLEGLKQCFILVEKSMAQNDLLTVLSAYIYLRSFARGLYGYFLKIADDLEKFITVGEYGDLLPELPMGYRLPTSYQGLKSDHKSIAIHSDIDMNIITRSMKALAVRKKPFDASDWRLDFSSDLNQVLNEKLDAFKPYLLILKKAMQENDLLAIRFAYLHIKERALDLYHYFNNIVQDSEDFWGGAAYYEDLFPEFPESDNGNIIPAHYQFPFK